MKNCKNSKVKLVSLCVLVTSCGSSLYKPLGKSSSDDAKKEDAIIALNQDEFDKASLDLSQLWAKEKTNERAQLYAIALLGKAGLSLFQFVTDALISADKSAANPSAQASSGNKVLDKISSLIPDLNDSQLKEIKLAIDVLQAAPNQLSTGLKFEKCLIAGIYAAPAIAGITKTVANIQTTLANLPAKLGTSQGSQTCNASADIVNQAGKELTDIISSAGILASRVADISQILGECVPAGNGEAVNEVTTKINKLKSHADKGCAIGANQSIGRYPVPPCMTAFILSAGGGTAVAGDGVISGCELFINCSDGNCF